MRTRLQRDYRFEAAHFLPAVAPSHPCRRMHGHSYGLTVTVEGEVDPRTGWVIDLAEIDEVVAPIVRRLDHRLLNEIDGLDNPTLELLASWFWQRIAAGLPSLAELSVSESRDSRCTYRGG